MRGGRGDEKKKETEQEDVVPAEISLKLSVNKNGRLSEKRFGVRGESCLNFTGCRKRESTTDTLCYDVFNTVATISRDDFPSLPLDFFFIIEHGRSSNMLEYGNLHLYTTNSTRFLSMIVHLSGK